MFCYYLAGGVSGIVTFLISYPLDTIKTQQQYMGLSFTQAIKRINRHRGWRGFYRGSGMPLIANGILNTLFFGLCDNLTDYFIDSRLHKSGWYWTLSSKLHIFPNESDPQPMMTDLNDNQLTKRATLPELFISGAIASTSLLPLSSPIELVKIKLQSQMKRTTFIGPIDCFKQIYNVGGVKGLYRGTVPLTLRTMAGLGVRFGISCGVWNVCESDLLPMVNSTTFGVIGMVGVLGWLLALPFDTIKTILQADDHINPQWKGTRHVAKDIFNRLGIKGFYRGFWNVTARIIPLHVFTFVVYDYVQRNTCRCPKALNK